MALKWSWAFGPETLLELESLAGWDMKSTNPADGGPYSNIVHTYTGDAADRYSLGVEYGGFNSNNRTPLKVGNVRGWAACYMFTNDAGGFQDGYDVFEMAGPVSSGRRIGVRTTAGNGLNMMMDGSLIAVGTVSGLQNFTWNHIALKYDMYAGGTPTVATWTAELYVNGVLSASGSRTSSNLKEEFEPYMKFGGARNANQPDNTYFSDFVTYDSQADPNPYGQFVTRTKVSLDVSDSGSWTPASNAGTNAQANNLSGSIATTPVVAEASPLTGENVIVSQTSIATQLGITPTAIYGVVGHLFASGSSETNLFVGVAESASAGTFTTGTAVVDGENMYAWTSAPTTPASPAWVGTDSIYLKTEVSGS